MLVTKEIIKRKFMDFNSLYFNSELPLCSFGLLHSFKRFGQFSFNKNKWNKKKMTFKLLEVSDYYDYDEHTLDMVILHEMIHYYLAYKFHDFEENMSHGASFVSFIEEFNKKHNTEITVEIRKTLNRAPNKSYLGWWWHNKLLG